MATGDRRITLRRMIEQAIHCLEEANSVLKNDEDLRCAADDVEMAQELIQIRIRPGIAKILDTCLGAADDQG